ncbi:MAG: hypothetical protein HJHJAOHD_02527 [Flavobacteriales bacterium]|nr:hypothetical protein [Flavobacteriales bacterium]
MKEIKHRFLGQMEKLAVMEIPVTQPWQSPYTAFDNNPILYVDPMGDVSWCGIGTVFSGLASFAGNMALRALPTLTLNIGLNNFVPNATHTGNNSGRFLGEDDLFNIGGKKKYERKRSKNLDLSDKEFHEKYKNKNWYKNYATSISGSTGWPIAYDYMPSSKASKVYKSSLSSLSSDKTIDIEQNKGTLEIVFKTFNEPDRLQIINAESGDLLFDSKTKISGGIRVVVDFNMNENSQIRILVNPDEPSEGSVFTYKIKVINNNNLGSTIRSTVTANQPIKLRSRRRRK